jgi:glycosyltransferase involved in cell wall biosynthesis
LPRYSIIIPTLDRSYLLDHTLKALLSTPRANIEVIVSDNSSGPETRAVVDQYLHDPRLRYFRTDRRLAVTDHWDFIWTKARGDYIIMNCDDDLATPRCLAALDEVIDRFQPDLASWHTGLYHHPDFDLHGNPNTLFIDPGHSNQALVLDAEKVARRFAELDWLAFPLGTSYCMSRAIGDRIIRETGRLFWPAYPDFSSALLALANVRPGGYVYLDALLGYAGRSKFSNAAGFCREEKTAGEAERLRSFYNEFGQEDRYPFHDFKLPFSLNGQASAIELLKVKYPHFAPGIDWSREAFFMHFYRELYGIDPNALIDRSLEPQVDAYVARQTPARQQSLNRIKVRVLEMLKNADQPPPAKKTGPWSKILKTVASPFKRAGTRAPATGAQPGAPSSGQKAAIAGAQHGFTDGFALSGAWDRVVAEFDLSSIHRRQALDEKKMLLSAHGLESLSRST